jgi:hypothetical protein
MPAIRHISDRLERAAVASEVAEYLGIDRSLVLNEFRRAPVVRDEKRPSTPRSDVLPMTERVVLRSVMTDPEIRGILLPYLQGSPAARKYAVWPILEVLFNLSENNDWSFTTIESRLPDTAKGLLSAAFFADTNGEIFTREQAVAYVGVLESEDRRFQIDGLRKRLKEAERNGDRAEAFRLIEELNCLQRPRKR